MLLSLPNVKKLKRIIFHIKFYQILSVLILIETMVDIIINNKIINVSDDGEDPDFEKNFGKFCLCFK
jgi:hypothetical protein